jgi:hypothetical protein
MYVLPLFIVFSLLTQSRLEGLDWNCFCTTADRSRGSLGEKGFDLGYFLIGEAQLAGPHHSLSLTRVAGADDRPDHRGMVQSPGDCDFSG